MVAFDQLNALLINKGINNFLKKKNSQMVHLVKQSKIKKKISLILYQLFIFQTNTC